MHQMGAWPDSALPAERAVGAIGMLIGGVEFLGPILLITGLLVGPVSVALLVVMVSMGWLRDQAEASLFCAALLGWYATHGAGALSLDRLLARGLNTSALPFATRAAAAGRWMDGALAPAYRLALRAWLAAVLFIALPHVIAAPLALLLLIGLATPLAAAIVVAALAKIMIMEPAAAVGGFAVLPFALLGVFGAGRFSIDALILRVKRPKAPTGGEPHVVIVGGGFGGIACAAGLRYEAVRVTLIDRNNYHLFQPLLYQVATASLSPGDIAAAIRGIFREDPHFSVVRGEVSGVDSDRSVVFVGDREVRYDYLVLATGATHSYFGNEGWSSHAPGLKSLQDAIAIRGRILDAFERAEATPDPTEREALLTFVVCGGGPTGVELAGAIAELARHGLERDFRQFDPAAVRVILVEASPRLLAAFPEKLSVKARRSLERMGVEVRVGKRVRAIDQHGAVVESERICASTVLWAAGVTASPAAVWLGQPADRAGRLKVAADLSVPGLPDIFAIGDTVLALAWSGAQVPGLAPAAKQGGAYVARVLAARVRRSTPPPPFCYRHQGSLATIGRRSAVADFGRINLSGSTAWWLWGFVHVFFLAGVRNRLSVLVGWVWSYFTYRVGVQLITDDSRSRVGGSVPLR
jgi:NADH dehydrogenase/putative oxidoreductase